MGRKAYRVSPRQPGRRNTTSSIRPRLFCVRGKDEVILCAVLVTGITYLAMDLGYASVGQESHREYRSGTHCHYTELIRISRNALREEAGQSKYQLV